MDDTLTYTTTQTGVEVQGGSGDDEFTAATAGVTLRGGAGVDNLIVSDDVNNAQIFGGDGNDTFEFDGAAGGITDRALIQDLGSGDTIDLSTLSVDTFRATPAVAGTGDGTGDVAATAVSSLNQNQATWFQLAGSTFIVADLDGNATFDEGDDFLVEIVGQEIDLAGQASFNDNGTLELG